LATSGTQTLTPTTEGAYTYSLICSNAAGASAATSVTLTVTVAATAATLSGHGGALDGLTLLALAALALAGWVRSRRAQIESVLR
jgi:PKD repeat protein